MEFIMNSMIIELASSVKDYRDLADKAERINVFANTLNDVSKKLVLDESIEERFSECICQVLDELAEFDFFCDWNNVWNRIRHDVLNGEDDLELKKQFFNKLPFSEQIKIHNTWRKDILSRYQRTLTFMDRAYGNMITKDRYEILSDAISFLETFAFLENYWIEECPVYDLPDANAYGRNVFHQLEFPVDVEDKIMEIWNQ